MNKALLLILGSLTLLASAQADAEKLALNYRVVIPLEESELAFEVTQDVRDGVRLRKARLSCDGDCDLFIPYFEETLDNILSVQFDSDSRNLMVVTWVTGSAYRVQAFSVSSRGIDLKLDIGSRAPPAVVNFSGQTVLTLLESRGKNGDSCLRGLQWNGSAFVPQNSAGLDAPMRHQACQ